MHESTLIKSQIVKFSYIMNDLDKIEVKKKMMTKHFYYCVLCLIHTRVLGKLSMEEN